MHIARLLLSAACLLLVCLPASFAGAAEIYRWVDESGRTHVSDVVPLRYQGVATRVDTSAAEITEEDRNAARLRADRERRQVDEQRAAARKAQSDATPGSKSAGEIVAPEGQDKTECAEKWRAYRESQECFAPYINSAKKFGHAHINEEAFKYCKPVPDPSAECGPAPDLP